MKAYRFKDDGYFDEEVNCQIDPLESKLAGKTIYLLPGNATYIEPLEPKEGFKVKWDKEKQVWEYEEEKKEPEPQPYVPTEKDKLQEELWDAENKLREMDYIGTKIATGRATIEEYADKIALMSELAQKVDELRTKIAQLEEE